MDDARNANMPILWRRQLPWLHIFRAFRIAVDPRKLLLAGLAMLFLSAGEWGIDRLPFAPPQENPAAMQWPWEQPVQWDGFSAIDGQPGSVLVQMPRAFTETWRAVLRPIDGFVEPTRLLFHPRLSWTLAAYAWTKLLWTLLVWSVFGGAITRMAALHFSRDERIGMLASLKFAAARLLSYFSAPLLPLAGIGFFWLLCMLGGLVGRIPLVGESILGALWILPLIFSLLMALILIGVAAGWPLMYATISAEGSDAFDGLSRTFSYVYDRPLHYLWYAVVAVTYGTVLVVFVSLLFSLTVYLAGWSVASGLGPKGMSDLYSAAPEHLGGTSDWRPRSGYEPEIGGILAGVWLNLAALVQAGFEYSYFWTATTIIYFLLRKSDDGTDPDEVYLPDQVEDDELLPLVGVADSDQPVIERPPAEQPDEQPDSAS